MLDCHSIPKIRMTLNLSHKIVHLDLKGAPLLVAYLEKFIITIKSWGVTGILLEWEDTFPYTGDLMAIGSLSNAGGDSMYSYTEVNYLIEFIRKNGLEPIQLVQTIGHMEFVLKHPTFRDLQEVPRSPAVLCPSKPRSQVVVRQMVDQALEMQPDAKFFHIGADEVWHIGICPQCQDKALNHKYKAAGLYLDHIKDLVLYIKEKRPNITVLMWDDMLRTTNFEMLQNYNLGESVIPVVWNYNSEESFSIKQELMELYGGLFPQVMFGSAFKGANGSCQVLSPTARYTSNHRAWVQHIFTNMGGIHFCGGILTGWSRYDHYATLCELLPASIPSLAACLRVLTKAEGLNIDPNQPASEGLQTNEWPGEAVGRCVRAYYVARQRSLELLSSDLVNTWLNPWQISRKYTVPGHVEGIMVTAEHCLAELQSIKADTTIHLLEVTGERSTEEWITSNVDPLITKITRLGERARERCLSEASVRPVIPE